jgi:hypothetical protein
MNATHTRCIALPIAALIAIFFAACSSEQPDLTGPEPTYYPTAPLPSTPEATAQMGVWRVELYRVAIGGGLYEWTWKIWNSNPGNGKTNAFNQDLSHWDFELNYCVNFEDIKDASTSTDGVNFTSFTPVLDVDGSLASCGFNTIPVLKFNVGTTGTAPTYYRLTVFHSKNYVVQQQVSNSDLVVFKSASQCQAFSDFPTIGCGGDQVDPEYRDETAWGFGTRFVTQGNWGWYFTYDPNVDNGTTVVDLLAGQNEKVGTVTAAPGDPGYLNVTYSMDAGNILYGIHLQVVNNPANFPLTPTGNPKVGLFTFNVPFSPPEEVSFTQAVPYTGGTVYIGAHAGVGIPII